jgi:hypothetical protein
MRVFIYLSTLLAAANGCDSDSRFRAETRPAPTIEMLSEASAATPSKKDLEIEVESGTITDPQDPIVSEESTITAEAAPPQSTMPTPSPSIAPKPRDMCVEGPDAYLSKITWTMNRSSGSAQFILTDESENIVLGQEERGARDRWLVLNFAQGFTVKIGCVNSVQLNLAGGDDKIQFPGLMFSLRIDGSDGNDHIEALGQGDSNGRTLYLKGGAGNDNFVINAGNGWAGINTDGN